MEEATNSLELSLLKILHLAYHHSYFLAATLDFTSFFTTAFFRAAHFILQLLLTGLWKPVHLVIVEYLHDCSIRISNDLYINADFKVFIALNSSWTVVFSVQWLLSFQWVYIYLPGIFYKSKEVYLNSRLCLCIVVLAFGGII